MLPTSSNPFRSKNSRGFFSNTTATLSKLGARICNPQRPGRVAGLEYSRRFASLLPLRVGNPRSGARALARFNVWNCTCDVGLFKRASMELVPRSHILGQALYRNALRTEAGFPKTWVLNDVERFLFDHQELTRRYFIRLVASAAAALGLGPLTAGAAPAAPELSKALDALEPHFTSQEKFRDVSRGKPLPPLT